MGLLNPFTCVVLKAYISNLRLHFLIFQKKLYKRFKHYIYKDIV